MFDFRFEWMLFILVMLRFMSRTIIQLDAAPAPSTNPIITIEACIGEMALFSSSFADPTARPAKLPSKDRARSKALKAAQPY